MRIALLPSTQWRNAVLGGGTEAQYAHEVCKFLKPILESSGYECMIFSAAQNYDEWSQSKDSNSDGARAAVAWKADFCLSVHSDGGYEFNNHRSAMVLYQEASRKDLAAKFLDVYCRATGYTSRGLQQRIPGINGVSVLRIPEEVGIPAILLERGWHDREPDATDIRNQSRWFAQAISLAISAIYPVQKRRVDIMLPSPENVKHVFPDVWVARYGYWLHIKDESGRANEARVIMTRADGSYEEIVKVAIKPYYNHKFDLATLLKSKGITESCSITVISANPTCTYLREIA